MSSASKRSFEAIKATCPEVDNRFSRLETALDDYRGQEQDARNNLRSALDAAYEEVIELEGKVDDLESQVDDLTSQNSDLISELKSKDREIGRLEAKLEAAEANA